MLTVDEIKEKIQDRKLTVLSEKTGISYMTLYNFATGRTQELSADNFIILHKYFEEKE